MNHTARGLVLCLAALLAGGCADQHEKNLEEQLKLLTELNEVLAGIQDKASLDVAISKLERLNDLIKANEEQAEKLEGRRELRVEYKEKLDAERKKFGAHIARIDKMGKEFFETRSKAMKDIPPFD